MKQILALLLVLAVSGCATSKTATSFVAAPLPELSADKAILYIYRDYAQPTAFASYLEVDGIEAASLNLSPGEHAFEFGWPFLATMPSVEFKETLEGGKVYAFQMQGSVAVSGSMIHARSAIALTDLQAARDQMTACCRYVPSKYKAK